MALMPVADALAAVLSSAEVLAEESVNLDDAFHRVLARDLAAQRTQPPTDMSAMDGYAVHSRDLAVVPAPLKVVGEVAASSPAASCLPVPTP
jgi:molybdopterin molybdotransferase